MSDKLLEAIGLEPDAEIVAIMVDSLCKVSGWMHLSPSLPLGHGL